MPHIHETSIFGARPDSSTGRRRGVAADDRNQKSGTFVDRLLFTLLILFSFGNWLLTVRHDAGDSTADGGLASPVATVVWTLIYLAAFVGVITRWKAAAWQLARVSVPLVLILMLACASTLWSDQPALTARRSIELLGTVTLAVYFAYCLGLKAFIQTLVTAISIGAIISIILITLFPSVGLESENDFAWAGFFGSKNFLGETMVLGIITTASLFGQSSRRDRALQIFALAIFILLLVGSKNGSGAGIAIMLSLVIPILILSRAKRSRNLAIVGGLTLVAAILVGLLSEDILGFFGKDATLSGRTVLWQLVVEAIGQRPALGYGYAAFWGRDEPAASLVYPYINWVPGTAHDGFLEIALNCGIIGEIIFIWLLVLALWRASSMFWQGRDMLSGWPLFAMSYVILKNLSDASLLAHGDAEWIIFVAAFIFATDAKRTLASGHRWLKC